MGKAKKAQRKSNQLKPKSTQTRRGFLLSSFSRLKNAVSRTKSGVVNAATYRPIGQINRREALGRGLKAAVGLGAIAAGAGYYADKRIPYWAGARHDNYVSMIFGKHRAKEDAIRIVQEIEKAKNEGHPYQLYFFEASSMNVKNIEKFALAWAEDQRNIRADYHTLLNQGLSKEAALQALREKAAVFFPSLTSFQIEYELHLAINSIRKIPIEFYSGSDHQNLVDLKVFYEENSAKFVEQGRRGNLLGMQKSELDGEERRHEFIILRDRQIKSNLESGVLFEFAKKLYPDLKDEKELRALSHLGALHRDVYAKFGREKAKIQLEEIVKVPSFKLGEYIAFTQRSNRLTERDARISALSYYFDGPLDEILARDRRDLAQHGYNKAINMSQQEFEQLNAEVKKIKGERERTVFIANYLIGENFFR